MASSHGLYFSVREMNPYFSDPLFTHLPTVAYALGLRFLAYAHTKNTF